MYVWVDADTTSSRPLDDELPKWFSESFFCGDELSVIGVIVTFDAPRNLFRAILSS